MCTSALRQPARRRVGRPRRQARAGVALPAVLLLSERWEAFDPRAVASNDTKKRLGSARAGSGVPERNWRLDVIDGNDGIGSTRRETAARNALVEAEKALLRAQRKYREARTAHRDARLANR